MFTQTFWSLEAFEGARLTNVVLNRLLWPYSTDSVFIDCVQLGNCQTCNVGFFNLYTLNERFHWVYSQPPTILESLDLIKTFTNPLYFDITSISGKSVGRTQKCYFRYHRCPKQLTFKKMKWFWKLILLSVFSSNMRRLKQDFFFFADS